jgi:hypothetical protein
MPSAQTVFSSVDINPCSRHPGLAMSGTAGQILHMVVRNLHVGVGYLVICVGREGKDSPNRPRRRDLRRSLS